MGWGSNQNNDITYINIKTPKTFGDFEAKEYSTGYLGGAFDILYVYVNGTPFPQDTIENGFFGGIGRIKIVPRRAGITDFTIVDSLSNATGTELVVGEPTKGLRVLPGYIHWVAMSNPNAVNKNKEAVYPYPIRPDYKGRINFSRTYADDPDNKNTEIGKNPRSYSSYDDKQNQGIDTIFVGHTYVLHLMTYDRYGNRNTIDSIFTSASHDGKGFWADSWTSGSEYLLDQDTSKASSTGDVRNEFWTIPTTDNNSSIPDDGAKGFLSQIRISYNGTPGYSLNNGLYSKPDLLNDQSTPIAYTQFVAWRDVFVMKLNKPGKFDIHSTSTNLVRLDEDNYNLSWTRATSTNTFDDGISYNICFYDGITNDYIGLYNVPYNPDTRDDAIQTGKVPAEELAKILKLGVNGWYNRNVNVVVQAMNKWGVTTDADQKLNTDFELNKAPEAFTLISNGLSNGKEVHVNAAPFTLTWNAPMDQNGVYGGSSVSSYNKTFNLDTLEYTVFLELQKKSPEDGYADTLVHIPSINVGPGPAATITKEFLLEALDGIDWGIYKVYAVARDRSTKDWANYDTNHMAKSNVFTITFIKSGSFARILVDDENKLGQPAVRFPIGTDHEFGLIAADADGNRIRAFGGTENPVQNLKIFALGVDASRYTGAQKLTLSVDGQPLAGDVTNGFILPSTLFVEGEVIITYNNTKSGRIHINVPDNNPVFKTVGDGEKNDLLTIMGTDSRDFITVAGKMEKLSVEVMPRQGTNTVFVWRKMEVIVSPADSYNNPIDSVGTDQQMIVRLSPRYPEEFERGDFGATRIITGRTNYILTPTYIRDDQSFTAVANENSSNPIFSTPSNSFRIVSHAPSVPTLTRPSNGTEILLNNHAQRQDFAWTKSTDPNNTPLISDVDGTSYNDVDVVTYSLKVQEKLDYVMPDSINTDEVVWTTGSVLYNLAMDLGGGLQDKVTPVNWYVVASDGLFETRSTSFLVNLKPSGIVPVPPVEPVPVAFALGQNYPNPFNPTTNIQYDIPKASDVKIVIYNILGQPVRTLVNERKEAARHYITWDGKNDQGVTVATGTYIYQIHAGEFSATKKMNLLK